MNNLIKILNIKVLDEYKLEVKFSDNKIYEFDLKIYFTNDSVFLILKDYNLFKRVQISNDGRSIVFPYNLDFCADALRLKASKC